MKRKRGHKKGKQNIAKEQASVFDEEFDIVNNNNNYDKEDNNSVAMEVDTPSSTGTDQHGNLANINHDGSIHKGAAKSVGRVKVKLRTPKMLDSSDALTQSDTDKSSQQHGLEKHGVNADRIEDSVNSSKKPSSIKIKSSKVLGLNVDHTTKPFSEIIHSKERKAPPHNPSYNKQELDVSLMIIRKVMKMDAADPFNVPVNPEALGIPDYFDIIDTPMDFGTICSNLEKNNKYMNSGDVYKDVKYIWENCYKYNNKGDYILDLMRRVKKNFMKYWTAAGLYSEQSKGTEGTEKTTAEDMALSGDGKVGKSGQLKHKKKKRHGRHHKHDCLCAICVLKRRRKEREENDRIAKGNFGSGGEKHTREFKQEESMLVESPGGEDSSSNTDESLGSDGDADEDKGEVAKMETSEKRRSPSEGRHEDNEVNNDDGVEEENRRPEEAEEEEDEDEDEEGDGDGEGEGEEEEEEEIEMDSEKRQMDDTLKHGGTLAEKSEIGDMVGLDDEYKTKQQEGQAALVHQQKKHKESQDRHQKAKLLESLCHENPMLSNLCEAMFPKNSRSVWSGPHSLIHRTNSARTRSIHAAIGSFME
uniref:Ankyrin repeat, bromo and BTB domain-containing protein DDB_G0293800 isoform X1 n=1 Tax=Cicer arietinum TaxID=3827 RepID=A0A3Q7YEH2_CICAR|nr:ankyrin repeat, bromo and BTB domain-containing protein DDB_G0293800 isoform X1 [Cicer arietinum]XP_027193192.1 ankyrin repeat, bromo and BTB domain-containing protein DDB_G0293800 isoform X1 [Cicer arietinum]